MLRKVVVYLFYVILFLASFEACKVYPTTAPHCELFFVVRVALDFVNLPEFDEAHPDQRPPSVDREMV